MQVSKISHHPRRQKIEIPIIGSPCDRLTAVLEEFEPGDKRFIIYPEQCGVRPRTVSQVVEREVEVIVPARLHMSVLDMNRFSIERVGGGGSVWGSRSLSKPGFAQPKGRRSWSTVSAL